MILRLESWVWMVLRLRARQAVVSAARAAPTGCSAMKLNVRSVGHGVIEAEPPPGDNRRRNVFTAAECVAGLCRKTPGSAANTGSAPGAGGGALGPLIRLATIHQ